MVEMGEKKRASILLAEDHTILRDGIRALLDVTDDLQVVGEVSDGREAIRAAGTFRPDLIILDLSMPGMSGLHAIKEIKRLSPGTKVVVLTVHSEEEYIVAALQKGADAYVLKDASSHELLLALRNALKGRPYISPGITDKVISGYLESKKTGGPKSSWDALTERERQVLKLIAEGKTTKEIADYLYISVKTAEKHRANLMKKLDLHNTAALTAYAMEKGLVVRRG
jgi:DNA-binding NarL/FixJ family response regulator